jgi:hypothetical protein
MLLSEIQYFPPITFFKNSYNQTHVYLSVYEIYRKMSFRNRCIIAGANGPISLSIPLEHGRNQRTPISQVSIDATEPWQPRHWKSIRSAYSRAPFFDYYEEELERLFRVKADKLMDWNLQCLQWVKAKTGWPVDIRLTESAPQESDLSLWEDRRDQVLPKNYQEQIPLRYRQVFEERTGFFPNLSVLDLLFNTGRAAGNLLAG